MFSCPKQLNRQCLSCIFPDLLKRQNLCLSSYINRILFLLISHHDNQCSGIFSPVGVKRLVTSTSLLLLILALWILPALGEPSPSSSSLSVLSTSLVADFLVIKKLKMGINLYPVGRTILLPMEFRPFCSSHFKDIFLTK